MTLLKMENSFTDPEAKKNLMLVFVFFVQLFHVIFIPFGFRGPILDIFQLVGEMNEQAGLMGAGKG
ncbi:MAG: hypothetical protein OEZ41_11555 [Nitrospirota bacterium]|nr:hypothetical protein [Nitrospirota bacterium]MDH5700584.1 hypothetical protein [Nitrospirota bacterium]